jgi:hypothetical protein
MERLSIPDVESIGVKYFTNVDGPSVSWKTTNKLVGHSVSRDMILWVKTEQRWGMSSHPEQIYLDLGDDEWAIAQVVRYENIDSDDIYNSKLTARYTGR